MKFGKKGKVSQSIKKEFDSEFIYNKKYLKVKIKSYNGKINTNFHNNKIPEGSQCICLLVILLNSAFRIGNNYYPLVSLEECKYVINNKHVKVLLMTQRFLLILIEEILKTKITNITLIKTNKIFFIIFFYK